MSLSPCPRSPRRPFKKSKEKKTTETGKNGGERGGIISRISSAVGNRERGGKGVGGRDNRREGTLRDISRRSRCLTSPRYSGDGATMVKGLDADNCQPDDVPALLPATARSTTAVVYLIYARKLAEEGRWLGTQTPPPSPRPAGPLWRGRCLVECPSGGPGPVVTVRAQYSRDDLLPFIRAIHHGAPRRKGEEETEKNGEGDGRQGGRRYRLQVVKAR